MDLVVEKIVSVDNGWVRSSLLCTRCGLDSRDAQPPEVAPWRQAGSGGRAIPAAGAGFDNCHPLDFMAAGGRRSGRQRGRTHAYAGLPDVAFLQRR